MRASCVDPFTKQAIGHAIRQRDIPLVVVPTTFAKALVIKSALAAARRRRDEAFFPPLA